MAEEQMTTLDEEASRAFATKGELKSLETKMDKRFEAMVTKEEFQAGMQALETRMMTEIGTIKSMLTGQQLSGPVVPPADLVGMEGVRQHITFVTHLRKHKGAVIGFMIRNKAKRMIVRYKSE